MRAHTQSPCLDGYRWLGVWCLQAVIRMPLGAFKGRTKRSGTEHGRKLASEIILDQPHYILPLLLFHSPTLWQIQGAWLMATTPPHTAPGPPALLLDKEKKSLQGGGRAGDQEWEEFSQKRTDIWHRRGQVGGIKWLEVLKNQFVLFHNTDLSDTSDGGAKGKNNQ